MEKRNWKRSVTLKQRMVLCLAAFFAAFALQLALNGYQARAVQQVQDDQMSNFNAISRFQGGVESSISILEAYRWENGETEEMLEKLQAACSTSNAWLWRIRSNMDGLQNVSDEQWVLYGAVETTYGSYNALLSRSRIFELKPLEKQDIRELVMRAVYDTEKGMGTYSADITDEAADFLADVANGDARAALNAVELGILTTDKSDDGKIHITIDVAAECIQKRVVRYDHDGDNHYDTISAFIKSMRGSDPDAAVYYLARMLYAGEDVKFIARRIMICASEDVGNADPNALVVAVSAAQAVERIGMPESQIILSQAAAYVATAPKSNAAYMGIAKAMKTVADTRTMPVPAHLQDRHYKGAEKLGHGLGYKYAHDYPNHYVTQQYLPDGVEGMRFYEPSENGYEKKIREHMEFIKREAGETE